MPLTVPPAQALGDGEVVSAAVPGSLLMGIDGTTVRRIVVDASGRVVSVGVGVAGVPAGGVLSVQGVAGGEPVPVSDGGGSVTVDGTVTANIGTTGGVALDATLTGGTQKAIARGGVKGATAAADVTSTSIDADHQALDVVVKTSALPTGAATEVTLASVLTTAAFQARVNTLGQKAMAASTPVVLASDQTAIPVTDNAASLTVDSAQLPAALVGARLDTNIGAWLGATTPTVGQKTLTASIPVAIASNQSAIPVTPPTLTKGTQAATGFSVQALKDAGRTRVVISFEGTAPATSDTLLTLVRKANGVAAAGATTIAVTAAKTLRVTAVSFSIRSGAAAAAFGTLTLRENPAGATLISSVTWGRIDLGATAASVGGADKVVISFPDGIEFSGTNQIGASLAAQDTTNVVSIEIYGFEY